VSGESKKYALLTLDPLRRFDCIVFDFDGTLVDSNEIKRRAYFEAAAALGDVTECVSQVLNECTGDRFQLLREIARRAQSAAASGLPSVEDLVSHYTRYCEENIRICPAVAGAEGALLRFAQLGIPMFINSATPTAPLRALLVLRGWTRYFRDALGSPMTKVDILNGIQRSEDVPFSRILMVGDGEDDRLAARKVGCAFAGVVLEKPRFQGEADLVLSDLAVLPDFVAGSKLENIEQ